MKTIVVANWKMNPATFRDAKKLFEATKKAAAACRRATVVVAPPALYLPELAARESSVSFAVQHAHSEESGAHTGEISMVQAYDAGARYCLIGHAERRALGETNADVAKKVTAALEAGLTPILCVGESVRTEGGEYFAVVKEQVTGALKELSAKDLTRILIVYEPLWTIGTETTMSPRDMHEMAIYIRKVVVEMRGDVGHALKILYGGSLNGGNVHAMLEEGDIVGLLVGRASIDAEEFGKLLTAIKNG